MQRWAQYINEDNLDIALNEWAEALINIPPEAIKEAINYCRDNLEWPPSIAEFRKYCQKYQGLPTIDEVLKQSIERNFYQPIVKIIFDKIGSWAFSHDSEKELRKKIENELFEISNQKQWMLLENKH